MRGLVRVLPGWRMRRERGEGIEEKNDQNDGGLTMNEYIKKIDEAARENLRRIAAAYKGLERAEKLMTEANASRDERRILNAKSNLLDAQDEVKTARKEAGAALDRLRIMRNELVQDAVRRTTVNPEAVDMAALELMKSGIMRATDYDAMLGKFPNNPTMARLIAKYAGDAADAEKDDRISRTAFATVAARARDTVNPEGDIGNFDGMIDLFARSINNHRMIPHYDELAAPFTGITNPGNPLADTTEA